METLIALLVLVIIFGLLFWLVNYVLPLPPPFRVVANAIVAVILIVVLLGGYLPVVHITHR